MYRCIAFRIILYNHFNHCMSCYVVKESWHMNQSNNINVITCNFEIKARINRTILIRFFVTHTMKPLTLRPSFCMHSCLISIEFSILFTNPSTLVTASNNQTMQFDERSFGGVCLFVWICISRKSKCITMD